MAKLSETGTDADKPKSPGAFRFKPAALFGVANDTAEPAPPEWTPPPRGKPRARKDAAPHTQTSAADVALVEPARPAEDSAALFEAAVRPAPKRAPRAEDDNAKVKPPRDLGWMAHAGGFAALAWLTAALALPLLYFGPAGFIALDMLTRAAFLALAAAPTLLIALAAAAVSEAARARRLVEDVLRATRAEGPPAPLKDVKRARAEIARLAEAMEESFARVAEFEGLAARQALLIERTIAVGCDVAEDGVAKLARERAAFLDLAADLSARTEEIGKAIERHARTLHAASTQAAAELTCAEQALETQVNAIQSSAVALSERTGALTEAADAAGAASGKLDAAIGESLALLSESARMTDAARITADRAVNAARTAADGAHEQTATALAETQAAAERVRAETDAMSEAAQATLVTLKEAVDITRAAVSELREAAPVAETRALPRPRRAPRALPAVERPSLAPARPRDGAPADILADAYAIIAAARIELADILTDEDLDEIAAASRQGPAARRRAVLDCAPVPVTQMARHLRRDAAARELAVAFRARPDLARTQRTPDGAASNSLRAYLLVDAALA